MTGKPRKQQAVLVLPDLGLTESEIDKLKENFRNVIVDQMKAAGKAKDVEIVVHAQFHF